MRHSSEAARAKRPDRQLLRRRPRPVPVLREVKMNMEDKLRHAKAEYDQYIDALLTGLDGTDQEFGQNAVLGRRVASAWADTLRELAPQMDYTLQLDKHAEQVLARFEHFLFFLFEFRVRHQNGDEENAAGVPLRPSTPPQLGSAAKPLL